LLIAEDEALEYASKIVSPHRDILRQFPENKRISLPWHYPTPSALAPVGTDKPLVIFPASTLGRKGAYELREALRDLPIRLALMGAQLEGDHFWAGFDTEHRP